MSAHGTGRMYQQGCRCDLCKARKRAYDRLDYEHHGEKRREAARRDYQCRHAADPKRINALAYVRVREHRQRHPLYATWNTMKDRCQNPNAKGYQNYGGRGIRVCAEWQAFATFESYINEHLGPRPEGLTLDRADNDGHYEPGNVRWLDRKGQIANRRKAA